MVNQKWLWSDGYCAELKIHFSLRVCVTKIPAGKVDILLKYILSHTNTFLFNQPTKSKSKLCANLIHYLGTLKMHQENFPFKINICLQYSYSQFEVVVVDWIESFFRRCVYVCLFWRCYRRFCQKCLYL